MRLSIGLAELVVRSEHGSEGMVRHSFSFNRALLLMSEPNFSALPSEERERRRARSENGLARELGYETPLRAPAKKVRRNLTALVG